MIPGEAWRPFLSAPETVGPETGQLRYSHLAAHTYGIYYLLRTVSLYHPITLID